MSILTKLREKFPVLTPPEDKAKARVAIAQDVLDTLKIGRTRPQALVYYQLNEAPEGVGDSFEVVALSLRQKRGKTICTVCAIGAACLSAVSLYDEAEVVEKSFGYSKYPTDTSMRTVLKRWFSRGQLALIECAFERSSDFGVDYVAKSSRVRAREFGYLYHEPQKRLEAIMGNIVENEGTFKP